MLLIFGQNVDKFLEISDTSTSKKLEQLIVAVTRLSNVDQMFSLRPRDTANRSKLGHEANVSDDAIQQSNSIFGQRAYPRFIQRSNETVFSSDICVIATGIISDRN